MLGDEMIFILTTNQEDNPMARIVVKDDVVVYRNYSDMSEHDYDIDMTDTKLGKLLLDLVNKKNNPKVKTE